MCGAHLRAAGASGSILPDTSAAQEHFPCCSTVPWALASCLQHVKVKQQDTVKHQSTRTIHHADVGTVKRQQPITLQYADVL